MIDHGMLIEAVLQANRKIFAMSDGSWLSDIAGEGYLVASIADLIRSEWQLPVRLEMPYSKVGVATLGKARADICINPPNEAAGSKSVIIEVKRTWGKWGEDLKRIDVARNSDHIAQTAFVGFLAEKGDGVSAKQKQLLAELEKEPAESDGWVRRASTCGPMPYLGSWDKWGLTEQKWNYGVLVVSYIRIDHTS
ncbi:hypothetical protein [Pyruvatibacter sp.]|uniref:hypothetical protein n=1 Tax=Pyruvatibacter sp. TaxID=1981328 RepID=UPI0032EDF723